MRRSASVALLGLVLGCSAADTDGGAGVQPDASDAQVSVDSEVPVDTPGAEPDDVAAPDVTDDHDLPLSDMDTSTEDSTVDDTGVEDVSPEDASSVDVASDVAHVDDVSASDIEEPVPDADDALALDLEEPDAGPVGYVTESTPCATSADCNWGNACVGWQCNDLELNCDNVFGPPDCCTDADECDDGNPCTKDVCYGALGACVHNDSLCP